MFKGLYQKVIFVDQSQIKDQKFKKNEALTEFIPVDGPADEKQIEAIKQKMPSFCQKMLPEDLHYISTLLDDTKQIQ